MSKPIIEIENIGKCYKIGHQKGGYLSLREEMSNSVKGLISRFKSGGSNTQEDFWALKDVSFTVNQGEAVGIIGRNGAGKSTLLKILSQITPPTEGKITFRGRIASLLEVGTGFHPELTGRENIFLNGAILGMTRKEIANKFDEIVAFSEVEKFLDTPVKRYSSGMYVRLAFAVAAHLEPEILVVDEVLAVGDAQFQKKCLGKMGEVASGGRTVLFVSHNMGAIRQLCTKSVLLNSGKIEITGSVEDCISQYIEGNNEAANTLSEMISYSHPSVQIEKIEIDGKDTIDVELKPHQDHIDVIYYGHAKEEMPSVNCEAVISDSSGVAYAFASSSHNSGQVLSIPAGSFSLSHKILLPKLLEGRHILSLYLTNINKHYWVKAEQCAVMEVLVSPSESKMSIKQNLLRGSIFLASDQTIIEH